MPRASKTIENTTGHRTKAEIAQRGEAEKALVTGVALRERKEVAENKTAHAEFVRINKLLVLIGKNDALIETVINRYCKMIAECIDFEKKREKFADNMESLMDSDVENETKYRLQAQMQKTIVDVDKQIQTKRKMLFDIEKENGLTIASALRSIPKKIEKEDNPLKKALMGDD